MKVISKIAIVLTVGALASAGMSNVHATCAVPGTTFGSDYFTSPIAQDPLLATGRFWGIGQFNPASPGGTDSGNALPQGFVRSGPGGFYIAGDWSTDALYDGCIQDPPNPQPAKMAVAWTTSDGSDSYFVALCSDEDASGTFNNMFSIAPGAMSRVPKAVVHASSRAGNTTNLTVGHEPIVGGVFNTGCALAVTGYKVYQQAVPRDAPAPSSPVSRSPAAGGWTLLGQGTESSADIVGQVTCGTNQDIYLLTTLVLDGNVEIGQGSRNSTRVECGPNLATPSDSSDQFRFIRKPKSSKTR